MTAGREPSAEPPPESPTTVGVLLEELSVSLAGTGVPPDRGGARDVVAAVLDTPRFWPSANRDVVIDESLAQIARTAARAMRGGMPFAYAIGRIAFRHLSLQIDRRALIPRPETELLVDLALRLGEGGAIADIGTGSGAIALALAAEGNFTQVIATDISSEALDLAQANLGAIPEDRRPLVDFRLGDLCAPLGHDRVRAVVSNPPYIATRERADLPPSVRDWEPALALYSGVDGMDAIRKLVAGAASVLEPGGALLIEIDARRAELASACAKADGRWTDIAVHRDLTGRDRFLAARLGSR